MNEKKQNNTKQIAIRLNEYEHDLLWEAIAKKSEENGFDVTMSQFVRHILLKEAKKILTKGEG